MKLWTIIGVGSLSAMVITGPVAAAVKTVALGGVSFYNKPYTYDFGGGSTVTFTTVDKTYFAYNPAGVSIGGSTQIGSLGAPFYNPPEPTSYFFNRGGSFGPGGELPQFVGYTSPAAVPYSIVEGLVGCASIWVRATNMANADIGGSTLKGFRYETTPGVNVAFGAVPEPASWAMLIAGFALTGTTRRRAVTA